MISFGWITVHDLQLAEIEERIAHHQRHAAKHAASGCPQWADRSLRKASKWAARLERLKQIEDVPVHPLATELANLFEDAILNGT